MVRGVSTANPELLGRVLATFHAQGVTVDHRQHPPATTTEALAAARGLPISAGVKALVMKIRGSLTVVALRADQPMDNRRVRQFLASQKLRFARPEELAALGLAPGQVPPFGEPLLPLPLVADEGILAGPTVAFTAGTHTDSLVVATADWVRVARPRLVALTAP